MACDATYFSSLKERRVMLTARQISLLPEMDCSKETVSRQIRRYGVPRCDECGFEREGGRHVFLIDFEQRYEGDFCTNHQRRNHLRRAGFLPAIARAA